MLTQYAPILILLAVVTAGLLGFLIAGLAFGPRPKPDPDKAVAYECGMWPIGDARRRFAIRFYVIAMLFIIFDIEVVFLYPWAVVFRQLELFGLLEMGVFLGILLVGYIYLWKGGCLEWE